MTIKDYPDHKIIILSKPFDNRAKILNIIYFSVFTLSGIWFLNMSLSSEDKGIGLILFMIAVVGVYFFAGYRFLNKALQKEEIIAAKKQLTISRSGFLSKQIQTYDVDAISNLRHLEKPGTTKHPLAGESFDYLGFQTEQQVITEMHGDNRIAFDYRSETIQFGENIYSWDFDELSRNLFEITEKDLTIKTETENFTN